MKVTGQIWNADDYNKSNGSQIRDATETIEEIIKDGFSEVDIIVDIGCGSGNVTKLLASRIKHNKIYASDIDPQMTEYADKNHNDGTIEYFPQDIGLAWENLDKRLTKLEGKVDLVWSNRVLHWVPEDQKTTAANTIARLLKPGGRCYINITLLRDLGEFDEDVEELKEVQEYTVSVPHQDQVSSWARFFERSGLTDVKTELMEKEWHFDNEEQYYQFVGDPAYQIQVTNLRLNSKFHELPEDAKVKMQKKYFDKLALTWLNRYGQKPTKNHYDVKQVYYEQIRVIGSK